MIGRAPAGRLYVGRVRHARHRPFRHRFAYRVFSLDLDIDRLDELDAGLRLFSVGRFNLLSFFARDHGPRDGTALRPWVEGHLAAHGIALDGGAIRLLCFPRILGFVFDPLSVYFCFGPAGELRAVLYEVRNTFGESHGYLVPVPADRNPRAALRQAADKAFHVSPFLGLAARYRFRLRPPQERFALLIRETSAAGVAFDASHVARRRPLTDGALLAAVLAHPLMTLKVVAAIHWQAWRLWRKGAAIHRKPAAPAAAVTFGRSLKAGSES